MMMMICFFFSIDIEGFHNFWVSRSSEVFHFLGWWVEFKSQPFSIFICVNIGWWTMTDEGGYGGFCDRRSCSCNTNKQLLTNYHQGHGTESLQSWNNQTGKWANRSWRRNENRHQSSERTEGKANKSIALVSKLGQTLLKWKINNAIGIVFFFSKSHSVKISHLNGSIPLVSSESKSLQKFLASPVLFYLSKPIGHWLRWENRWKLELILKQIWNHSISNMPWSSCFLGLRWVEVTLMWFGKCSPP